MNTQGSRRLLTFRLDQERIQRLRARLAREGRTMSEVVTHGLRQYVQPVLARGDDSSLPGGRPPQTPPRLGGPIPPDPPWGGPIPPDPPWEPPAHGPALRPRIPPRLVLPERVAARLRELRASGRSELLSATLAALNQAGWPLRPLADALGISKQAVQARVRRRAPAGLVVPCEPPPPFPQRRMASAAGLRPHLTIKIDHALRASAHRVAAGEGSSLTQVVEGILDRYLRHGMADGDQAVSASAAAPERRSR